MALCGPRAASASSSTGWANPTCRRIGWDSCPSRENIAKVTLYDALLAVSEVARWGTQPSLSQSGPYLGQDINEASERISEEGCEDGY